jgi:regulator of replication initiation timing
LKFENIGSLQTIDELQEENNTLKAENGHLLELLTEEMYKNVQITQTFAREMKLQSMTYSKKGENIVLSQI